MEGDTWGETITEEETKQRGKEKKSHAANFPFGQMRSGLFCSHMEVRS